MEKTLHQLRLVVYPIVLQGFNTSQVGIAGFLNHQQYDIKLIIELNSSCLKAIGGVFFGGDSFEGDLRKSGKKYVWHVRSLKDPSLLHYDLAHLR